MDIISLDLLESGLPHASSALLLFFFLSFCFLFLAVTFFQLSNTYKKKEVF